ncbi:MAG: 3-hydroxybutyryl-CoA dehydrogenase [Oligoflexales bacterium]
MDIKNIGVIGSGQMGGGIAQICAVKGFNVVVIDKSQAQLDKAKQAITKSLDKFCEKGVLTAAQKDAALAKLLFSSDYEHLSKSQFIVEAVSENESLKAEIFRTVDKIAKNAIIASNTSSISITKLANYVSNPEQFIGMHFMNPVPIMKLVEIIPGMATSKTTLEATEALARILDKETVRSQDYPGFIINRILMPMINEAFRTLMEGVATAEDIDKGMKLGTNQPMGPLALADFIGLDTCLAIMNVLYNGLGDQRYSPCPLLVKYVEANFLGKKTGRGVYKY